jgi:hypothetical protein
MYKVIIRPVLTYASETWTLSKTNERQLSLFERKLLRCIFGAKQENGTWRKRYNYELYETFNEPNIVNYYYYYLSGCTIFPHLPALI